MTSIHGLQPMPVADAICQPGRRVEYLTMSGESDWIWSHKFRDSLPTYKRVHFGAAPHHRDLVPIMPGDTDEIFQSRLREAVGPQRLPFDWMWFEGIWPDPADWFGPGLEAVAVRVSNKATLDTRTQTLARNANAFSLFTLMTDGRIVRAPTIVTMGIDDAGMVTHVGVAAQMEPHGLYTEMVPDTTLRMWTLGMVMPAMWAIGMVKRKNVKTQEVQRVPTKTKKQRRLRNTGLLSYNTIVLPGVAGSGEGNGRGAGMTRLHTVRGHFATYTREAPLFGKLVGTYWRPWHLSGNPERGVIESDYKLAH